MENKINAVTIASDAQFHFTRVSVNSFLETNTWFNGKITLVVHPNFPLSSLNFEKLKAIYQNIEIVLFSQAVAISSRLKITPTHVQDQLRCFIFSFAPSKLLFFSNRCLFMKDVTSILQPNKIMVAGNYSIVYVDSPNTAYTDSLNKTPTDSYLNCLKNSLLQTNSVEYTDTLGVLASTVPDPKYTQLARTLANASFIDYDTVAYSDPKYGKINQVWLYQNHLLNHKLSKPLNFNSAVREQKKGVTAKLAVKPPEPFVAKPPKPLAKITNSTQLIGRETLFKYLNGKKIAVVANSAELLNYQYGELIDSHDIIIRFNGYVTSPKHTGTKTNIHCIFREARFNLDLDSDYLIILSKPISPWKNAVDEILSSYPSKRIINYNYPNSKTILDAIKSAIIPTSGLASILLIKELNLSNYKLTLFGFNGYANRENSVLRSNDSLEIAPAHNYKFENFYISQTFEQILPEVFQKNKY
jgi:hypothetical protein